MFYASQLDENTRILVEAETTGAFTKNEMEIAPDPERAVANAIELVARIGASVARQVAPGFEGSGCDFDVTFSVKMDGMGSVMLSQRPGDGQITCSVRYTAPR